MVYDSLAASFASQSAFSFPTCPLWAGMWQKVICWREFRVLVRIGAKRLQCVDSYGLRRE